MADTKCCIPSGEMASNTEAYKYTDRQYLAALVCQNNRIIELLTTIAENTTPESA